MGWRDPAGMTDAAATPPSDEPTRDRDALKDRAVELGVEFARNVTTDKLAELVAAAEQDAASAAPSPAELPQDDAPAGDDAQVAADAGEQLPEVDAATQPDDTHRLGIEIDGVFVDWVASFDIVAPRVVILHARSGHEAYARAATSARAITIDGQPITAAGRSISADGRRLSIVATTTIGS